MDVECRYEELEAINVSEKLSKLNRSEKNEKLSHDDDVGDDEVKTGGASATGSQVVPADSSNVKNENKLLGICYLVFTYLK